MTEPAHISQLITLRSARADDMRYLNAYAAAEGMDALPGPEHIHVAANADDTPVAFIRLALGANGIWHVNPIVTCSTWRGYGVGRVLTEWALQEKGELRLVARGSAVPFYQHMEFSPCTWEEVDISVTEDCAGCSFRQECNPQPMKRVR